MFSKCISLVNSMKRGIKVKEETVRWSTEPEELQLFCCWQWVVKLYCYFCSFVLNLIILNDSMYCNSMMYTFSPSIQLELTILINLSDKYRDYTDLKKALTKPLQKNVLILQTHQLPANQVSLFFSLQFSALPEFRWTLISLRNPLLYSLPNDTLLPVNNCIFLAHFSLV